MDLYEVIELLGKGTFGTVHLCQKKHNKEKIVVKQIPLDFIGQNLKKAQNEVKILKSVDHPNVIVYLDSFVQHRTFHIVMEFASHGNLQQLIAKRRENRDYLEPQNVMNFFCQILMGLNHIHEKGIVHRDLKCENIFVTGLSTEVLKIGDFGISKLINDNRFTNTMVGTCNYMAPEICDGKPYNNKSDMWSLGCVLYEMCELEKLFDGTVSNIILSIANGKFKEINTRRYGVQMQELLNLLLKPKPSDRPDTKIVMTLGDVFPSFYSLPVNLGCIF